MSEEQGKEGQECKHYNFDFRIRKVWETGEPKAVECGNCGKRWPLAARDAEARIRELEAVLEPVAKFLEGKVQLPTPQFWQYHMELAGKVRRLLSSSPVAQGGTDGQQAASTEGEV